MKINCQSIEGCAFICSIIRNGLNRKNMAKKFSKSYDSQMHDLNLRDLGFAFWDSYKEIFSNSARKSVMCENYNGYHIKLVWQNIRIYQATQDELIIVISYIKDGHTFVDVYSKML